jgi:hypothetical protein
MQKDEKYIICHKGKKLITKHWVNISSKTCKKIKDNYYKKPIKKDVDNELIRLRQGYNCTSFSKGYYFKDIMMKVRLYSAKWSIEEMLECDDLIRYYYSRMKSNEKVCPVNKSIQNNFETIVRIGGGRVAMNPSNFPIKSADLIIKKYNVNNNYYDFSCGWGIRLLSSLRNNVNYYGTDPNNLLVKRLKQLSNDYKVVNKTSIKTMIRCVGSETYIPKWKSKFGLIFSSPPYYCLEDYKIGKQSIYKKSVLKSYNEWIETFIKPTINNCTKYLIDGGYLAINIKNTMGFSMYDDIFNILSINDNLKFVCEEKLKNICRPSKKKNINVDEKIMVFKRIKNPL